MEVIKVTVNSALSNPCAYSILAPWLWCFCQRTSQVMFPTRSSTHPSSEISQDLSTHHIFFGILFTIDWAIVFPNSQWSKGDKDISWCVLLSWQLDVWLWRVRLQYNCWTVSLVSAPNPWLNSSYTSVHKEVTVKHLDLLMREWVILCIWDFLQL